jgi:hypothetical protein
MPRQFHKITSKEDPNKQIILESMGYEQALEEALDKLGWVIQSEWNEPYNSMFQDEHMMSLMSQEKTIKPL